MPWKLEGEMSGLQRKWGFESTGNATGGDSGKSEPRVSLQVLGGTFFFEMMR